MNLKKVLLAGAVMAGAAAVPAQADIVDNPHFKVLGLVIVWGSDGTNAPIASDFIIDTGTGTTAAASGDADLISGDVRAVVTGTLTATPDATGNAQLFSLSDVTSGGAFTDAGTTGVLDAADSFAAFGLDNTTDVGLSGDSIESSFYVASNTAFAIDAAAAVDTAENFTLADVGFAMSVTNDDTGDATAFGSAAQVPGTAAAFAASVDDLGDLSTASRVFSGTQRTASARGSIMEQSVRFDVEYTLGGVNGYDLSLGDGEISADVTYTVFVP